MKALDLLKLKRPPSILIYGPAGSGKTALVSQASTGFLFDFDRGMRTAATLQDSFSELRQEIEFDEFVDMKPESPTAWNRARNKIKDIIRTGDKWPYDAIIIDSLTGMCRAIYLQVMLQSGGAFNKPQIQHWGMMTLEMENALSLLRAVKGMLIVTAHEALVDIEEVNYIRPLSITKNHSFNKLAFLFDEVWRAGLQRMPLDKKDFWIMSDGTSKAVARTRSGLKSKVVHNSIGLKGVLEMIKFKYGDVKKE